MRIVSQNGLIDVPYEMTALHATDNHIRMCMAGDTGKGSLMAEYSSLEKAKKVMGMMQQVYESSLYYDHVYDNAAQVQRPYIFMQNTVFQMPQDSEVGVS
jgi:hypothetical protein